MVATSDQMMISVAHLPRTAARVTQCANYSMCLSATPEFVIFFDLWQLKNHIIL